jgi:catechol 2,3-dioxygenase
MMGPVALRVADLERSLRFYRETIGFQLIGHTSGTATLGAAGVPLLVLREVPGVRPVPRRATGLYHFAILVPTRADLGRVLQRLIEARVPIGQGDHLVSEALYLSDPDDNGIEIYRDRPRDTWRWQNGQVQMATDPVDLQGLLVEAEREGQVPEGLPPGTTIGHVHLKVGDIPQASAFYHELFGFDVVAQLPSALFVSAGGYHHHLGMNIWESEGGEPPAQGTTGLYHFAINYPTRRDLAASLTRLLNRGWGIDGASDHGTHEAIYLHDPDFNGLELAWDRHPDEWPRRDGTLTFSRKPLDFASLLAELGEPAQPEHLSLLANYR